MIATPTGTATPTATLLITTRCLYTLRTVSLATCLTARHHAPLMYGSSIF